MDEKDTTEFTPRLHPLDAYYYFVKTNQPAQPDITVTNQANKQSYNH